MQRWIYTQKPRKFFSKDRSNPGNSFEIGTDSGTKVAGRAGAAKEARQRVDRYFEQGRRARAIGLLVLLGIALLLAWLAYDIYSSPPPTFSQDEHLEAIRQLSPEERQNAYLLLIRSGDEHFQKRQFEQAIEEYSRAADLVPKAKEPMVRIARSYKYLCEYYGRRCGQAGQYEKWVN